MSEAAVVPSVVVPPAVAEPVVVPPLGRVEPVAGEVVAGAEADWMKGFGDDLKAEASLKPFAGKSPEDLARAFVETKKLVGSRIELPKADDPDSFLRFAAAVRPEKADDYTIAVPDGQDASFAESMRPVFHDAGLHPQQVERLVTANNQYVAAQQAALEAAGAKEVSDLEAGMGKAEFAAAKLATNSWLTRMGIPVSFDNDLARMVGAGNSVRVLFDIAARTGELGKIGDTDMALALGNVTPEMAQKEANAIVNDPAKAKILNGPDGAEKTELQQRLSSFIKIIEAAKQ